MKKRVLVVVSGGIAEVYCDDGVDVIVFDTDNYDDEDDPEGMALPAGWSDLAPEGIPCADSAPVREHPR